MRVACLLALAAAVPAVAADPDWPQFRGPNRDGLSPDTGLLKTWPDGGPKLLWKSEPVGERGFSSVAVVSDLILTLGDVVDAGAEPPKGKKGGPPGTATVFAVERETGKVKWKVPVGPSGDGRGYPGPRSTPTVDKEAGLVFAMSPLGKLVCLQLKDGKEVWKVDVKADYGGSAGTWSYAESVLVDGDNVICTPGGSKATLLALDKKTGKEKWKGVVGSGGDTAGYSSVVVTKAGGTKQYVTLLANGLVGFSEDGKMLWRYGEGRDRFGGNTANIPTVVVEKDQIFSTAGYNRGAALLTLSSSGGKVEVKEEYFVKTPTTKHGGVVKVGDYVYGDASDGGGVCCVEFKTGKLQWTHRGGSARGGGSVSVTAADGMLYAHYANGVVELLEANPKEAVSAGSFRLSPKAQAWAHPVVIGGKLYIREDGTIYCYDVKASK